MKITSTLLLTILLISSLTFLAQEVASPDQLLKEMITEKGIIGITAAYSIDGKEIWKGSEGYACKEGEIPFSEVTLTRIASIAKPMTSVATMMLVEEGKLELDAPISNFLPDFPKQGETPITVKHLLGHTSGIPQYQSGKEAQNKTHYSSLQEAMTVFQDRPLLFEPGSDFFYTTYGYVVLGRILEKASGLSYEELMESMIWDRAGMSQTGIEQIGTSYENKSCLYHKDKKKAKESKQNDLSNRIPGGGFYSTLEDVMKFGNALLEGKFISDSLIQEMTTNQYAKKEGNPYGLGWYLYAPAPNENLVIGHSGEQTGVSAQLMILPKSRTVVVVLANTSGAWKEVVGLSSKLIQISEAERKQRN
ncbi:MAG: serine hydrolase domain-containing protein [Bacteroidota bacterium]